MCVGGDIATIISDAGINTMVREETQCTRKFAAPHEELPIPGAVAPAENGYHFKGVFTTPGDSHSFNESMKVLAMPFIAPWGRTGDAIDKVIELKPEYVLPIHDWHYTQEAKDWLNGMLEESFKGHNVQVLSPKNGIIHEIE